MTNAERCARMRAAFVAKARARATERNEAAGFDPETGARRIPIGGRDCFALIDEADFDLVKPFSWTQNSAGGYAKSRDLGRKLWMHRMIVGAVKGQYVDHINGNTLDNRRCNLRICSQGENMRNRKARNSNNRSGALGVTYIVKRQRYRAFVSINGKPILGPHRRTLAEATDDRARLERQHYGQFAPSTQSHLPEAPK